mgnify:FL=1
MCAVLSPVISGGAFLGLPIGNFADVYDKAGTGKVYVYEVLFVLLFFCQGERREKAELAFTLFDFNERGFLSEVCLWLACVVFVVFVAACKINGTGGGEPWWVVSCSSRTW